MARNGSGTYSRVPGSAYTNGTTADGSELDAEFNDIATEITGSLAKNGETTPTANLPMGTYRHTGVGAAAARTDYARAGESQDSTYQWLTSVAGTDTITAAGAISVAAYATGQTFRFATAGANTGAVTININSIGAKAITKNGTTALVSGDLISGAVYELTYDGTRFQLQSSPAAGGVFSTDISMSGASIFDANASIAAHATTMDPWSLGNYVTCTGGAVTFTAMAAAPQAGAEVELYMNAAHVFTDGAVFEVDGNANYTATAGDRVLLRAKSTTVFTVHPRKADGTALVGATTYASAAENIAGTIENKAVDPLGIREAFNCTGTAPVYACRAWVNFDGTTATPCTIRASGNVTSVTKVSTGIYTINFTNAMPDINYCTQGSASGDTNPYIRTVNVNGTHAASVLVGSVTIRVSETSTTGVQDAASVSVAIFR